MNLAKKTILFGWEMGGGLGHLCVNLRVADALAADGHRPVFVCRDVARARRVLGDRPWPIMPAPTDRATSSGSSFEFLAESFADILAVAGFGEVDRLRLLVSRWDECLRSVQPDLVVANHSPILTLAAAGSLPVIDVGSGFCQPPTQHASFPRLITANRNAGDQDSRLRKLESRLCEVIAAVQRERGKPEPGDLPSAFAGVVRCVTAFPEMDPYREQRGEFVVGSIEPVIPPRPWPMARGFFAYLDGDVSTSETILSLLAGSGLRGEAYVREAAEPMRQRLRELGLVIHDRPQPFADVLARARVIVHHGGLHTSEAALRAGRPQLLFPAHLEQWLNSAALHRLGVAHYLRSGYPASDVVEGMRQLQDDPRFAHRASELAQHFARVWPSDALPTIVARCRELLGVESEADLDVPRKECVTHHEITDGQECPSSSRWCLANPMESLPA